MYGHWIDRGKDEDAHQQGFLFIQARFAHLYFPTFISISHVHVHCHVASVVIHVWISDEGKDENVHQQGASYSSRQDSPISVPTFTSILFPMFLSIVMLPRW